MLYLKNGFLANISCLTYYISLKFSEILFNVTLCETIRLVNTVPQDALSLHLIDMRPKEAPPS